MKKNILSTALPLVLAIASVAVFASTACTKEQVARVTTIAVSGVECVDKAIEEHPEMTPEQVAISCGLQAVPDVINLIAAKKARRAAARAACARP